MQPIINLAQFIVVVVSAIILYALLTRLFKKKPKTCGKYFHIRRAPLIALIPLLACSSASAADSRPYIHAVDIPAQAFALLSEMPPLALWFALATIFTLHAISLCFISTYSYKRGYGEGYRDSTSVITDVGEDIAAGIERRLNRQAFNEES